MNNMRFELVYECCGNDNVITAYFGGRSEFMDADIVLNDSGAAVTLKPKTQVELKSARFIFDRTFSDDDRFFAGGYQSWTTSLERTKKDRQPGLLPALNVKGINKFVGISSDSYFVPQEKKEGQFHSHCYTYIKNVNDPSNIEFFGSLNERTGFTYFKADMNEGVFEIVKDVEGVKIDGEYKLFDVIFIKGEYDDVFDRYFKALGAKEPRLDRLTGYTSWYNYFRKINQSIILRDLDAMDVVKDNVNIFQIDDGYETFVGDWLDPNPDKFPLGMGHIASKIHEKNYMAGIWLAPFNVQIKSRTYKEHPDWVIKHNGRPVLGCAAWGGAYTLDFYKEGPREYIKHFFDVVFNEWKYDMVKLDFLYSQCLYPREGKSRGQIMCEALDFLRECCKDKIILGCGAPIGPAITTGNFDACRVSCDISLDYTGGIVGLLPVNPEIPKAENAMLSTVFRRGLNRRAFLNDPDVFFLRYSNLKYNIDQKLTLGTVNHIFGDVLFVSDNMEEYIPEDIEAVKKFYSKPEFTVTDVNLVDDNKKVLITLKDANGKTRMFWFNLKTGYGNPETISGIGKKR